MPSISATPGLDALGWDDGWMSALEALSGPTLTAARISRVDRGLCTVMTGSAERRVAITRGLEIAVGDWVAVDMAVDASATTGPGPRIVAVLPRRCAFRRALETRSAATGATQVVAANIDTVLLCDALDGGLTPRHLERYLALAWQSGATPVVLITKSDSAAPAVLAERLAAVKAVAAGVDVVVVSSTTGSGIGELAPYLVTGQTVAVLGLSGAGKSTLVNLLAGAEILTTSAVRRDGKGRHTTTHRELVVLPGGGLLIDTPGMRALSVAGAADGVEQTFEDIELLAGSCQYANCSHADQKGCAISVALSEGRLTPARFEGWVRLRTEPKAADHEAADREAARTVVDDRKRKKAAKVESRRSGRP